MGLFDGPMADISDLLDRLDPEAVDLPPDDITAWEVDEGPVILKDETGLELGSTSSASLSLVLWGRPIKGGPITLVGPDFQEARGRHLPLAQVVLVAGRFGEDAEACEGYRRLWEAAHRIHLRGLMIRVLPSRQSIWYRVSREAQRGGLSARVLGSALLRQVLAVPAVETARVLLVTEEEHVRAFVRAGELARDIVRALWKMTEDPMELDCESCEHEAVCSQIDELRELHARLAREEKPS